MAWPGAGFAKVAGGRHQPAPKDVLPNTVHHHASQQWILLACSPFGKMRAPLGLGRFRIQFQIPRQQLRRGRRHLSAQVFRAAPVHHTRHPRLDETPDEARARRLFLVLADVRLNRLQRRRPSRAVFIDLLNEMRVDQCAPLAVHALPLDFHVAKGQARHALEVIDLVIIFAVRAQAHKAHCLRLGKFQQRPRLFLGAIRRPRAPGHCAVLAVIDAAHRRAPALRHMIRPAHLCATRGQGHVAHLGIRPKQLQFIYANVRRFEIHLDRLELRRAEMHLAIAPPILLPRARAAQFFAFTGNRLE